MTRNEGRRSRRDETTAARDRFADLFGGFWDSLADDADIRCQVETIEKLLALRNDDRLLVYPLRGYRLTLALAARGYAVTVHDHAPATVTQCAALADQQWQAARFRPWTAPRAADAERGTAAICLGWDRSPDELAIWMALALEPHGRALIGLTPNVTRETLDSAFRQAGFTPDGCSHDLAQGTDLQAQPVVVTRR